MVYYQTQPHKVVWLIVCHATNQATYISAGQCIVNIVNVHGHYQ